MGAHYERAWLLSNQGRYEMAERELREELAEFPYHGHAHAFLGHCLAQQKRMEEALEEGAEGLRLAPHLAYAHYMLAITYGEAGRLDEAEASLRESLRLEPRNVNQLHSLSWIQFRRGEHRAALETADRGLAIDPQHVVCLNSRAQYLRALGRRKESEAALRAALALDPTYAFTHANLAWTLWSKARGLISSRHALPSFREALRLNPNLDWARSGALAIYLTRGRAIFLVLLSLLFLTTVFGLAPNTPGAATGPNRNPSDLWFIGLEFVVLGFFTVLFAGGPVYAVVRWNRFGRSLLSPAQLRSADAATACFLAAGVAAAACLFIPPPTGFALMFLSLALIGPLTRSCEANRGPARRYMSAYLTIFVVAELVGLAWVSGRGGGSQGGPIAWMGVVTAASCYSRGIARKVEKLVAKKAG